MKKQLAVVLGVAMIATPAFASKARLQALGEDIYGSFYVDDNRNIFRNAALVNNYSNFVTFEWGDNSKAFDDVGEGTSGNAAADALTGPRADGGVFMKSGNLNYGLYLGDVVNDSHLFRAAAGFRAAGLGGSGAAANEENNVSLWVAGDAGIKWGASLVYSKSENDQASAATDVESQSAMRARVGVAQDNWEAFASINLKNEIENGTGSHEFKGKLGFQVGGIYKMNDYRFYAVNRTLKGERKGTAEGDIELSSNEIGVGRQEKLNDKTTLFTKASLNMLKTENDLTNGDFTSPLCLSGANSVIGCQEYKSTRLPVVIGLEHRALEWLTIRGSVGQTVYGSEEDKNDKRSINNTTLVAAGATLHFGDFVIDGVIGNNEDGETPTTGGTSSGLGQIRTDALMSRVSMTYSF